MSEMRGNWLGEKILLLSILFIPRKMSVLGPEADRPYIVASWKTRRWKVLTDGQTKYPE